jgi:hypothetical protein
MVALFAAACGKMVSINEQHLPQSRVGEACKSARDSKGFLHKAQIAIDVCETINTFYKGSHRLGIINSPKASDPLVTIRNQGLGLSRH